jgi:uncharacterized sporulation protein YeaH/YhbH (DUF444 family)
MLEIIEERYPVSEWNIYGAQASDGENWGDDSARCRELLVRKILRLTQYYAYVEITPGSHQTLWEEYEKISGVFPNFAMQTITELGDIYPVFRKFLVRRAA